MHIVILDGGSTNPGDVSWAPLRALGSVTVYDSTKPEEIVERAKDAEAVILNRNVISREIMQKLPKLRFIGLLATGYNTVDVKAAGELGITVCNVPLYCVETVAQQAFALLLELCNHTEKISAATRGGDWDKAETMSHSTHPLFELYGKTLGIVGFGHIGQTVAKLGAALGMKILVYSRTKRELPERYQWAELDALFKNADVVSLHCPLTDETRGLVNAERLNLMKPTAFLINTARGAVIDEQAVADGLNSGHLAGAGIDVAEKEPIPAESPLLSAKNCVITPHIAWACRESRERLIEIVKDNFCAFLAGKPKNNVAE